MLDPKTIALPDRPGNNRADSFTNVLQCSDVGLVCVIPGHRDTLRISGKAKIIKDDKMAEQMRVNGKPSKLILLIQVERVLSHCPKAFLRSGVWSTDKWPSKENIPSLAELMVAHADLADSVEEMDSIIVNDAKNRLY